MLLLFSSRVPFSPPPAVAVASVSSSVLFNLHEGAPPFSCFLRAMSVSADSPLTPATAAALTCSATDRPETDILVQYVVLRRDLIDSWPLGSVVTQGCHAAVAAVWAHRDHSDTLDYCSDSNIDSMRKVTLEVKGETQIRNLSEKLTSGGIAHKLWIEQPENIPTCIATRPYPKSDVAAFFKKLKLCK